MSVKKLKTFEDRLPIYREVLSFLESGKGIHDKWNTPCTAGLCILLPCAWGDITWEEDFIDSNGKEYSFTETFKYFPEAAEYYINGCARYCELYLKDNIAWRIKILKEIIENGK